MSSYYHVEKYRSLKRKRLNSSRESRDSSGSKWEISSQSHSDISDVNHEHAVISDNEDNRVYAIEDYSNLSLLNQLEPMASSSIVEQSMEGNDVINSGQRYESGSVGSCSTNRNVSATSVWSTESINCDDARAAKQLSLREKLKRLCLENISILTNRFISDLLVTLRSEGLDVPTIATVLLGTNNIKHNPIEPMISSTGAPGNFRYFGIENGLVRRICPDTFKDSTIKFIANVDGLPIFNHSKQTFWPILGQVYHEKFYCKSFVVALWHRQSKPGSIEEFLEDFVQEVNYLQCNGLEIGNNHYHFQLQAIVADTPARAFLKCIKGHTGFYACERCVTSGISVVKEKKTKTATEKQRKRRRSGK